jgi:membrane protein implicated in regulation of membrane protease activity
MALNRYNILILLCFWAIIILNIMQLYFTDLLPEGGYPVLFIIFSTLTIVFLAMFLRARTHVEKTSGS